MSQVVVNKEPATLEATAIVQATDAVKARCILVCWRPGGGWKVWEKLYTWEDAVAVANSLAATWAERRIYKLPDDPILNR